MNKINVRKAHKARHSGAPGTALYLHLSFSLQKLTARPLSELHFGFSVSTASVAF